MPLKQIATAVFLTNLCTAITGQNPEVIIRNGIVRGRVNQTEGGNVTYTAFEGIPYAKPPVGDLRFSAPQPAENWTGVWDATRNRNECVQGLDPVTGSEDCLFINVYTPHDISSEVPKNIAVMVWVHGGAFIAGNSDFNVTGPDYFLNENVIVVMFNYRLGVFGFLSTEDAVCPGNNALKDQLLALRWVRDNIGFFGGNNKNVTIFGESAGSAAISYLLQSPLSEGLFQKIIMESGTTLCLWTYVRNPRKTAFAIGKALFVDRRNSSMLINGLRKKNYTVLQIVAMTTEIVGTLATNILDGLTFGPSKEPNIPGAVVIGKSHELLKRGAFRKIPTIIGFTSLEGLFFTPLESVLRPYRVSYDVAPDLLVPVDMNINAPYQLTIKQNVGFKIKQHYFGPFGSIALDDKSLTKLISDGQFVVPIHESVKLISRQTPTYFYRFAFKGALGGTENDAGVPHAGELNYLWRMNVTSGTPADYLTVSRMVRLWSNFAKYGNPTPKEDPLFLNVLWPLTNNTVDDSLTYLNIDSGLTVRSNPEYDTTQFWDGLYKTYGRPPFDTY